MSCDEIKKNIFTFTFSLIMSPVCASSDADKAIQNYVNDVQKKIKNNWKPPKNDESYNLITSFKIDKFGSVKNLRLVNHNANRELIQAAFKAIKAAEPFPSFSKIPGFTEEMIEIEFSFDYNIKRSVKESSLDDTVQNSVLQDGIKQVSPVLKSLKIIAYVLLALFILWSKTFRILDSKHSQKSKKKQEPINKTSRYDPTNVTNRK